MMSFIRSFSDLNFMKFDIKLHGEMETVIVAVLKACYSFIL